MIPIPKRPPRKTGESEIVRRIREAVGASGEATVYRNNSGVLEDRNGTKVRFGVGGPGAPDLIGWRASDAKFIGIEVKTDVGRVSKDQAEWIAFARSRGCLAGIARSIEDAFSIIRGEQE